MIPEASPPVSISRRNFLQGCAATLLAASAAGTSSSVVSAEKVLSLDQDWLFGGKWSDGAAKMEFDDSAFTRVTLPHTVAPLSWKNWRPADWQDRWAYHRHFHLPAAFRGLRIFLHFERVMAAATVTVNGHSLPQHLGGYLPFRFEITELVREGDNIVAVEVDARWLKIPPAGSPRGPEAVDYLLPGGITGSVSLHGLR